jgi:hypothetical protein
MSPMVLANKSDRFANPLVCIANALGPKATRSSLTPQQTKLGAPGASSTCSRRVIESESGKRVALSAATPPAARGPAPP